MLHEIVRFLRLTSSVIGGWLSPRSALVYVVAILGWPGAANATSVTIQLNGHVLSSSPGVDVTGVFSGGVNTNASLSGDAYTATITYDTASAPAATNPVPNYAQYERDSTGGPSFLNISVTINGYTETVTGVSNYQKVIVDPLTPNSVYFATSNHGHDLSVGAAFDESFADFNLIGALGLTSNALPTSVDLSTFVVSPSAKIGDLYILSGIYGPAGNNTSVSKAGYLYLGLDSISSWGATTTPLPAALPLFASGLGALGLLGWRRKRKATAVAA